MNNQLAKYQAFFLAAWLILWIAGGILPGGLSRLAYSLRDIFFLLASGLTIWIGLRMYRKQEKIILFYMAAHIHLLRKYANLREAAAQSRRYQRAGTILQTGQVCLMVGGLCFTVGLYYFFW